MSKQLLYQEALSRQALRQGRDISPINRAVGNLIFNTSEKAINDSKQGKDVKTFNVVSAPTGSSKTQSAIAYATMMHLRDPEFSCAFIVEEIRHANEIFKELAEEIPREYLGVWTSFHDKQRHKPSDIQKYGFVPELISADAIKHKKIAIFTHHKWMSEMDSNKDDGVRRCLGVPRDILFVDEQPSFVEIIQKTPSDILKMRDILMGTAPDHPCIKVLTEVANQMDETFTAKGNEMVATDLLLSLEGYQHFNEMATYEFVRDYAKGHTALFEEGIKFLVACARGYVFLSRRVPPAFVGYLPLFKPEPNVVILDATADISGLYPLLGGKLVEGLPEINYANLTINQIESPKAYKSIQKVMRNRSLAVDYAKWIKKVVMKNTKEGDKILVVVHKDMYETHALLPSAPTESNKDFFPKREAFMINWGQGIGSNTFNKCTQVFMFNEFYKPRRIAVANTLGAKGIQAKDSDISSQNGKLTGDYSNVAEGDLLRWLKQLASRGNIRNINEDSTCGHMTLHTSMDYNRLIKNVNVLFPNAVTPTRNLEYSKADSSNSPKRRENLINFLSTTKESQISFVTLGKMLGINSRNMKRELNSAVVQPTVTAYGWQIATSKELLKGGKGLWLIKTDSLL